MSNTNPFTITFGKQPNMLISRFEDTDRIISTFNSDNPISQVFMIEGIRGSGKTVLMTSIANLLSDESDWIVINLNPTMDLLSNFALRLSKKCNIKSDVLSRGFSVSAYGFGVGINGEDTSDYVGIIEKSFKQIIKKRKKILITIDEVLNDDNMKVFASQFQIFIRQNYPIFLIMTGLRENINAIQNNPSLTFLLRSPKVVTGPLSILQITHQYRDAFNVDNDRALELANYTKGYAFAFQALGVCYYENAECPDSIILEKLDELLDDFVYKKLWSSLTSREKDIIHAMDCDEEKVGSISTQLGVSAGTLSKYKDSLIEQGIVESSRYGYIRITLPRFLEVTRNYK